MNLRQDIQNHKAGNGLNIWLMRQLFIEGRIITIKHLTFFENMHLILTKNVYYSIISFLHKIKKKII